MTSTKARKKKKKRAHWMRRPLPREYTKWKAGIANKIRVEAIDQGWSWPDLAFEAGVGLSTVRKFLEYKTRLPHAFTIWKLANALGLNIYAE